MGFDDDTRRAPQRAPDDTSHDDPPIVCARCEHAVTTAAARCERGDPPAHTHTFVNPSGFVFDVACFTIAPGAVARGHVDATFSWFPGFTWQIVACARCDAHLGWRFALAAQSFYGLIATAIRIR